jgi:hypothetical protein
LARCFALAVLVLAVALAPAAARADGDPASDYLLTVDVFLPFDAKLPARSAQQLTGLVKEARAQGYPIKVALIAGRYDLGSVVSLYGQPQHYAAFLGQELSLVFQGTLLVVMPQGYGVYRHGRPTAAEQHRLAALPTPAARHVDVATAAVPAVQAVAAAAGRTLSLPQAVAQSTTRDRIKIAVGGLALVLVAAAAVLLRRRRRHGRAAGFTKT